MPVYEVEAPSGVRFRLEGDSPPTEKELEEIFATMAPEPEPQPAQEDSFLDNALDVAGEFAAGANRSLMWIPDTATKAANLIPGVNLPTPSEAIQGATGYMPGEGGFMEPGTARNAVAAAGEVLAPGAMATKAVQGRNLANPAEAAAEFAGLGSSAPVATTGQISESVARDLALKRASGDAVTAKWKLSPNGRPVPDAAGRNALKVGYDEGTVGMVKASDKNTKAQMLQIVDTLEKGLKNKRYAASNRPIDALGDSVAKRVQIVANAKRNAGQRLDGVAKTLQGKDIDFSPAVNGFVAKLENEGITFVGGKPVFQGSTFEGVDTTQNIIKRVVARMRDTKTPDAYDVHRLKRFIDEQVDYGKTKGGMSGKTESMLKSLRRELDQTLDQNFPEYKRVNDEYAETKTVLDAIETVAGTRVDIEGAGANKALGQMSRKLLSNYSTRQMLANAFDELDSLAKKYGKGVAPSDDIITQVAFVDSLEKQFGPSAVSSLQGEVAKAVAQDGTRGAQRKFLEAAADRVFGSDDAKKIQAMRALLR